MVWVALVAVFLVAFRAFDTYKTDGIKWAAFNWVLSAAVLTGGYWVFFRMDSRWYPVALLVFFALFVWSFASGGYFRGDDGRHSLRGVVTGMASVTTFFVGMLVAMAVFLQVFLSYLRGESPY